MLQRYSQGGVIMAKIQDQNINTASDGRYQSSFAHHNPKARKILRMVLKFFVIVPVILFVITVILGVNSGIKLKTYHECTGTIVGFYETNAPETYDSDAHKTVSPVVSYTVDGKNYEFIGSFYSTDMKVGKEISILYHNEDPSNATMKSGLYFAPAVLGSLTLFFTLFYVTLIILKSKGLIRF